METISVNGETYVKASSIARELGYTTDYVGQLCRSGAVEGQIVGRSWYVSEDSLRQHKKSRYRSTAAKSKSLIHKTIAEASHSIPATPSYLSRTASYEADSSELWPKTQGSVQSEAVAKTPEVAETTELDQTETVAIKKIASPARPVTAKPPVSGLEATKKPAKKLILPKPKAKTHKQATVKPASHLPSTQIVRKPQIRSQFPLALALTGATAALILLLGGLLSLEQQLISTEGQVSTVIKFDYQNPVRDANAFKNKVFSP